MRLQVSLCCLMMIDSSSFPPSYHQSLGLRRTDSTLTVAADAVLVVLGCLGAAATLRHFLFVSGQQSFNL